MPSLLALMALGTIVRRRTLHPGLPWNSGLSSLRNRLSYMILTDIMEPAENRVLPAHTLTP